MKHVKTSLIPSQYEIFDRPHWYGVFLASHHIPASVDDPGARDDQSEVPPVITSDHAGFNEIRINHVIVMIDQQIIPPGLPGDEIRVVELADIAFLTKVDQPRVVKGLHDILCVIGGTIV